MLGMHLGYTKITDLQHLFRGNHYVTRFEITMDNIYSVEILYTETDLMRPFAHHLRRQLVTISQHHFQCSTAHVLQIKVDLPGILDIDPKEADNMSQS